MTNATTKANLRVASEAHRLAAMSSEAIIAEAETRGVVGTPGSCTECLLANMIRQAAGPDANFTVTLESRTEAAVTTHSPSGRARRFLLGAGAASVAVRFDAGDLEHLTFEAQAVALLEAEVAARVAATSAA